jgi:hypothetical protein
MEGVIPNSKLVILPSAQEGEAWKRELFLRPGKWIPWVTLTVILGTVVLAVVVLVLRLNEMVGLLFFVCRLLRAYGCCTEGGRVGEETGFSSY